MERRSAEIQSRGSEYFEQIIADREEETLHLEFKTISVAGGPLTKQDKNMIGKAVGEMASPCAFAVSRLIANPNLAGMMALGALSSGCERVYASDGEAN